MADTFRALCVELIDALDSGIPAERIRMSPLADRARALLAQLEPDGPTDDEIEEWADACPEAPLEEMDPEVHGWRRCFTAKEFSETIRAAIARWGHPAAARLRNCPTHGQQPPEAWGCPDCVRELREELAASSLLQQQAAPVPGASNTYFEFIILDADDCTQAEGIATTYDQALSEGQHYLAVYQQDGPHTLELRRFEVLNPNALPLPAPEGGESQP